MDSRIHYQVVGSGTDFGIRVLGTSTYRRVGNSYCIFFSPEIVNWNNAGSEAPEIKLIPLPLDISKKVY